MDPFAALKNTCPKISPWANTDGLKFGRGLIFRISYGLIYSEVYGYCLIAMGIESFEWFELDIFGLAPHCKFRRVVLTPRGNFRPFGKSPAPARPPQSNFSVCLL
jgi:hypothetical protein